MNEALLRPACAGQGVAMVRTTALSLDSREAGRTDFLALSAWLTKVGVLTSIGLPEWASAKTVRRICAAADGATLWVPCGAREVHHAGLVDQLAALAESSDISPGYGSEYLPPWSPISTGLARRESRLVKMASGAGTVV